jgi:hypothetical protein
MIEHQSPEKHPPNSMNPRGEANLEPVGICQLGTIPSLAENMGRLEKNWQMIRRIRRFLKRRWTYLVNWRREINMENEKDRAQIPSSPLKPGDRVKVKSRPEIQATLNRWNHLGGCGFMDEMWTYCNQEQKVLKRVERFLDERDYRMKRSKNVVILEGLNCKGTKDLGPCDRNCFYFWREEWLERVPEENRRSE